MGHNKAEPTDVAALPWFCLYLIVLGGTEAANETQLYDSCTTLQGVRVCATFW